MNRTRTLLAAWAIVSASGCGGKPGTAPAASPRAAASASRATNAPETPPPISFVAPHSGDKYIYLSKQRRSRKIYVLRADAEKGQYFGQNTGRSSFVNPHITFFGAAGRTVVADAPAGLVVERDKTVLLTGGARAHSSDGVTLHSDRMTYDDATGSLRAEGNVVMQSTQGSELRGSTLLWNLGTGAVDVSGAH